METVSHSIHDQSLGWELDITVRRAPKSGATLDDCEDATLPRKTCVKSLVMNEVALAISDGATSYSYAKEWAEIISAQLAHVRDASDLLRQLPECQTMWAGRTQQQQTSWYAAAKLKEGAHATLVTLCLTPRPEGLFYRSVSIGDSCLVHLRGSDTLHPTPWPVSTPEELTNFTHLLPSRAGTSGELVTHLASIQGEVQAGDEFLLMTDALAAWWLARLPAEAMAELRQFFQTNLSAIQDGSKNAAVVEQPGIETSMETTPLEPQHSAPETAPVPPEEISHEALPLDSWGTGDFDSSDLNLQDASPSQQQGSSDEVTLSFSESEGIALELGQTDPFQVWAEQLKSEGELRDDDVSFIHVRIALAGDLNADSR
ncbi:protein phosphatase 2C domain-containing protein [Deinococcus marmoris]|uniref:protein phosphatase 2C domain-containing protein n=1 Tax=Deinococcus marmoris TaxID=249408 RepID=UPI000AF1E69B|nr:protein phosphatase 2C domain-containing protein [Deinococcus marmoris]